MGDPEPAERPAQAGYLLKLIVGGDALVVLDANVTVLPEIDCRCHQVVLRSFCGCLVPACSAAFRRHEATVSRHRVGQNVNGEV